MNTFLRKLAFRYIISNSKQTVLVVTSIVISVTLILSSTIILLSSFYTSSTRGDLGAHISYSNLTEAQLSQLEQQPEISWVFTSQLVSRRNVNGTWISVGYLNDGAYMRATDLDGIPPQGLSDIVIQSNFLGSDGKLPSIGDVVILDLGDGINRHYTISGIDRSIQPSERETTVYISSSLAKQLIGTELRLNAVISVKNADNLSVKDCNILANSIANRLNVSSENISVNTQYFENRESTDWASFSLIIIINLFVLLASGLLIRAIINASQESIIKEYGKLLLIGINSKELRSLNRRQTLYYIFFSYSIGAILGNLIGIWGVIQFDNQLPLLLVFSVNGIVFLFEFILLSISMRKISKQAMQMGSWNAAHYTVVNIPYNKNYSFQNKKIGISKIIKRYLFSHPVKTISTLCSMVISGMLVVIMVSYLWSWDDQNATLMQFPSGEFQIKLTQSLSSGSTNSDNPESNIKSFYLLQQNEDLVEFQDEITTIAVTNNIPINITPLYMAEVLVEEDDSWYITKICGITENEFNLISNWNYCGPSSWESIQNQIGIIRAGGDVEGELSIKYFDSHGVLSNLDIPVIARYSWNSWAQMYPVESKTVYRPLVLQGNIYFMPMSAFINTFGSETLSCIEISTESEYTNWLKTQINQQLKYYPNLNYSDRSEYIRANSQSIVGVKVFFLVASILTFLCSLINFFNTIITGLLQWKKDFTIMKALGMGTNRFKCIVFGVCIFYTFITLFFSLCLGIPLGKLTVFSLIYSPSHMDFKEYIFPVFPLALYILSLFTITLVVIAFSTTFYSKLNLNDT